MKEVRTKLTNTEKLAQNTNGLENETLVFNMNDKNIDTIIKKERAEKFNQQVDDYVKKIENHVNELKETSSNLGYDITKLEIKPMFSRILITLFSKNPFQRLEIKNGLVVDTGGLAPQHFNSDKGVTEDDELRIVVGTIQEVGPEVKYVKPGDTIFLDIASARPVPFYKQGLYCMQENQIIALVNENLTERFNERFNGRD